MLATLLIVYVLYVIFNREHFVEEQASSIEDLEEKVDKLSKEFHQMQHAASVQSNQAEAATIALQGIN
jgi:outer membrane murein-binding lipoprotein Lpp